MPCLSAFTPNPNYSDIDERQFRVDGGAIKNIYQADSYLRALIREFLLARPS